MQTVMMTTIDEVKHALALRFVEAMEQRFQGYSGHYGGKPAGYVRDCDGGIIESLDQLLVAIEDGRWPVEEAGHNAN